MSTPSPAQHASVAGPQQPPAVLLSTLTAAAAYRSRTRSRVPWLSCSVVTRTSLFRLSSRQMVARSLDRNQVRRLPKQVRLASEVEEFERRRGTSAEALSGHSGHRGEQAAGVGHPVARAEAVEVRPVFLE